MKTSLQHQFTLKAGKRKIDGSEFIRGGVLLVMDGNPRVATLLADKAWGHTTVRVKPAKRRNPLERGPSPLVSGIYKGTVERIMATLDELERLTPEQLEELAALVVAREVGFEPIATRIDRMSAQLHTAVDALVQHEGSEFEADDIDIDEAHIDTDTDEDEDEILPLTAHEVKARLGELDVDGQAALLTELADMIDGLADDLDGDGEPPAPPKPPEIPIVAETAERIALRALLADPNAKSVTRAGLMEAAEAAALELPAEILKERTRQGMADAIALVLDPTRSVVNDAPNPAELTRSVVNDAPNPAELAD